MQNLSGIHPTEYKCLVKPDKVEKVRDITCNDGTVRQLVVNTEVTADQEKHASTQGVLIDISPMAFKFEDWPSNAHKPQIGDRVAFSRYIGHAIKGPLDDEDYFLINDKDIIATLESKNGR